MRILASAFSHISVLVAVLNVMGLASIMTGLAAFFRRSDELTIKRDPVLILWIGLHLYVHIMVWWRLYGLQTADDFTFFHYLFFLFGPMCLYFGSLLLLCEPDDDDRVDMPAHLERVRRKFFTFEALFWAWAVLLSPIVLGAWTNVWPFWVVMTLISVALACTRNRKLSLALTIAACAVHVTFIFLVALKLRGS